MSKRTKREDGSELQKEYDFSGGARGKHAQAYRRGHTVKIHKTDGTTVIQHYKLEEGAVLLAPDVREYFSDSDAVKTRIENKLTPRR
jgi:hypothetical protein